jgi:adenosine deaminase
MALLAGLKDLRTLPKAELHLHLPTGPAAPSHPRGLERLVRATVANAAADGVAWLQPHFDLHAYGRLGPRDAVLELVLAAGEDEGARRGVGFGLTMAVRRHEGPQAAEELARFAARHAGKGVYALGLTGDESQYPAAPFARAFALARDAGLTAAPHAGELGGPDTVRDAVLELGATRVAHGVRAVQDPELLEFLVLRGVTFDVCLSSNLARGLYPKAAAHPLPELLAAGLPCSLGADDTASCSGLLAEYRLARAELGLTNAELAGLARTSVTSGDAPAEVKAEALAGIDAWLSPQSG